MPSFADQRYLSGFENGPQFFLITFVEVDEARFSTNGATGEEATPLHLVLSEKLCEKTILIRKRISFTIIRTALIALRGKRENIMRTTPINECGINIMISTL